jgi:hypothetical protein
MDPPRRWCWLAFGAAVATGGCTGDLVMLDASVPDGSGGDLGVRADLAPPPPVRFAPTIQGDLDALGCTAGGACHAGSAPMSLIPNAAARDALLANYAEVRPRAMAGAMSPLLVKPQAGSGHLGATPFASTADPTYQRWLGWVQAGAPSGLDLPDFGVADAEVSDGGGDGDM